MEYLGPLGEIVCGGPGNETVIRPEHPFQNP
jgi:hypothetical protein